MICPKCQNPVLEKSYAKDQIIHGLYQIIGKARVALTIQFCNFCNSYKTILLEKEKAPVKAEA